MAQQRKDNRKARDLILSIYKDLDDDEKEKEFDDVMELLQNRRMSFRQLLMALWATDYDMVDLLEQMQERYYDKDKLFDDDDEEDVD